MGFIGKHRYIKNIPCECILASVFRRCMKIDFLTVAVSGIFEFSGNQFELGKNKSEREVK